MATSTTILDGVELTIQRHDDKRYLYVEIKPQGFWSSVVKVYSSRDILNDKENPATVRWGAGGTDGSVDELEAAQNFAKALEYAVQFAREYNANHGL